LDVNLAAAGAKRKVTQQADEAGPVVDEPSSSKKAKEEDGDANKGINPGKANIGNR
jgi:hypothetical protein